MTPSESALAYHLSRRMLEGPPRTYLFLAPTGKEAARFQADLEFFLEPFGKGEVFLFPSYDVLPYAWLSPHTGITCDRIQTLFEISRRRDRGMVLVTTPAALLPPFPPKNFLEFPLIVKKGEEISRDRFVKTLLEWGYQNVPVVLDRGNFSIRGGLIDLFPPLGDLPLRIEWMGDTAESIRTFDPSSQRSKEPVEEATILPVREILLTDENVKRFAEKAREAAEARDLPRSAWASLVEKIRERIPFPGMETYLPLFYESVTTFWDWLPTDMGVVVDDPRPLTQALEDFCEEAATLFQPDRHLIEPTRLLSSREEMKRRLKKVEEISFACETHEEIRREIEISKKTLEPLAPLAKRIEKWVSTDAVALVASSPPQAQRMADLLSHYFPKPIPIASQGFAEADRAPGTVRILVGELSRGFRLPAERITIVTEEEIFGQKVRRETRKTASSNLSAFSELKPGDPIVHKDHGIGLYQGMVHMNIDGGEGDYLLIEYQGGDKLYLPVYRMNLVQRYTGTEGRPRIDKLGGASWAKIRGKSEKAIRELAGELLNLYAARSAGKGFAFSPPNDLFEDFEASFPFEETPDQERAIAEVLEDMQKGKPMDRLVLGDVGYGKTEVALRAAFKAALDGKQTAFLVPTTLLAFQHYDRFVERFKNYPVKIEMLSRFRSSLEQKKILKETAQGAVDILIGTHRILQPDVSYKDLGLLIIDEEHRFGVEQKEKIKRLKKGADVLAMSATPIPRSLYMSLVGIRGISVIETPPRDRLSIRTFVMPFQDQVIHEAVVRELRRGGQGFFVHNDIQTIGRMKEYLQKLVPEAKIEIGHGQMEENQLEDVMIRFLRQEFNLLLCTTIIESGIDIPTANTILINQADRFGISQIYQLRGRVGRGNHRAYAYLLVPEGKGLTPEAEKRLSVLQRFSDLGVGYKMASYDLEIRGAGNILGTQQSGQMAAIGYELYTELLEHAVRELKGEKLLDEIDPELHFRIPSFLPEDYIPDPPVRLEMYRRLASLEREEEVDPIAGELEDRFGRPPPEVQNLLELSALKTHAKRLRIKQIRYDGNKFLYAFDPSSPLPPEFLTQRIKKDPKRYRLTPDFRFTVHQPLSQEVLALTEAKKFLRELVLHLG